jgi:hypothetical protein
MSLAEEIFDSIINGDNILVTECIKNALYEKTNLILEAVKEDIGQSIFAQVNNNAE